MRGSSDQLLSSGTAECECKSDSCDWEIPMHIYLEQHTVENAHECELCHWTFSSDSRLTEHKQLLHSGVKPHRSHNRNRPYRHKISIASDKTFGHKHVMARIWNVPSAPESNCDQTVNSQDIRRSDSSLHEMFGVKSEADNVAETNYSTSEREIISACNIETSDGKKSYQCDECCRVFDYPSRLIEHKQAHSGLKPFVCRICGKAFGRNRDLNRHMIIHSCDTDAPAEDIKSESISTVTHNARKSTGCNILRAIAMAETTPLSFVGHKIPNGSSLLLSNICTEIPRGSCVKQMSNVATSSCSKSGQVIGTASSLDMPAAAEPNESGSLAATIKVEPSSLPVQFCDVSPDTFRSSGGQEAAIAEVSRDFDPNDEEISQSTLKVEPRFSPEQFSDTSADSFGSYGDNESDSTELNYDFDANDLDETRCSPTQLSVAGSVTFTVSANEETGIYKDEPSAELDCDFDPNEQEELCKSAVNDEARFSPLQLSDIGLRDLTVSADQLTYTAESSYTTDAHDQEICRLYSLEMAAAAKKLHECGVCLRVFDYPSRLADHMQVHNSVKPYVCGICSRAYIRKNDLKKHKEAIHEMAGEVDNVAETNYSTNEWEIISACSIETSGGKKSYKCDECCRVFDYPSRLIEHKQAHSGLKPYVCRVCGKAFSRNRDLNRHMLIHSCDTNKASDYIKTDSTSLTTHSTEELLGRCSELLRQKAVRPRYPCEMCNKTFGRNSELNRHLRTHAASCSTAFPGAAKGAYRLAKTLHVCEVCNVAFRQPYMLARHRVLHSTAKPHSCDVCHRSFNYQWNLKVHKRIHANAGAAPYPCDQCGRPFYRKIMLDEHMLTHSGETPHKCEYCPKSFRRPHDLLMHRRNHTGQKPFECAVCRKSFSRKNVLVNHVRVHSGDRQYRCEICDRAFIQRSTRDNHRRTHSRDKPYKCYLCGRSYARSWTLVAHIRLHTSG